MQSFAAALEQFDPVVGLEVHVELNTATKMFSAAPNEFGAAPNTQVSEVDLGLPGVLPVINRAAVEAAILLGLALHCTIAPRCTFARKHYFYPDLPKNFQTSQYDEPIAFDGWLDVVLDDGTVVRAEIERAHLEEDAGKLTHTDAALVDYNRAGVPLIEVVGRPVEHLGHRAPEFARAYVQTIRDLVRTLDISAGRMEHGNLRCDANVSLTPRGWHRLGTRTETKNVNSLRAVAQAVEFEIRRQATLLGSGQPVVQQTRHWQESTGTTTGGRLKSDADDYRYFPEPDLVPIVVDQVWRDRLAAQLPELPVERRRRLTEQWGLSNAEFHQLLRADVLDEVEATVVAGASPQAARKWWTGEIIRQVHAAGLTIAEAGVTPEHVVELERLVAQGTLTDRIAREIVGQLVEQHGATGPAQLVAAQGLAVVADDGALTNAIRQAIVAQPEAAATVAAGKTQAVGVLIGEVMRATGGRADAKRVRELLLEHLG